MLVWVQLVPKFGVSVWLRHFVVPKDLKVCLASGGKGAQKEAWWLQAQIPSLHEEDIPGARFPTRRATHSGGSNLDFVPFPPGTVLHHACGSLHTASLPHHWGNFQNIPTWSIGDTAR